MQLHFAQHLRFLLMYILKVMMDGNDTVEHVYSGHLWARQLQYALKRCVMY